MALEKLKEIRTKKGITQEEMAKKLGYRGKSGYCQLENGAVKMTIDQAKIIAEILNEDIKHLFFDKEVHVKRTNPNQKPA